MFSRDDAIKVDVTAGSGGSAIVCRHERVARSASPDMPDSRKGDVGACEPVPMVTCIGKDSLAGTHEPEEKAVASFEYIDPSEAFVISQPKMSR